MRVFQLNTFCGVKSTGRIATEIAKLVQADGGECRIGYGVPGISADSEPFAVRTGNPFERKLHGAMRKLLDAEGYGSTQGTHQLIREMRDFSPDLIHLHNLHGCYLNLEILFQELARTNKPVVWTLHDCWPFTGHCAYFDYVGCNRWQTQCHDCPQKAGYPVCIGISRAKQNFERKKRLFTQVQNLTFVAPCQWMTKPLGQSFLKGAPVRVIPNGVNLDVFRPVASDLRRHYSLETKKLVLSVAAEWDERKGLRYLLETRQKLESEYCLVVIGLSEQQVADLPEGIIGLTHTANATELAAWYTAADCLANPTMEDNMPMVNLEALACGTPVAVFDTGGCAEAVGECGCIVPQGNTDALCEAIHQLCLQKPVLMPLCLERAKVFDSRKTFQSYLDLYKELCS